MNKLKDILFSNKQLNDKKVLRESVESKDMSVLIDQLSNSMDFFSGEQDFINHIMNTTKTFTEVQIGDVWNAFWKIRPSNRMWMNSLAWEEWINDIISKSVDINAEEQEQMESVSKKVDKFFNESVNENKTGVSKLTTNQLKKLIKHAEDEKVSAAFGMQVKAARAELKRRGVSINENFTESDIDTFKSTIEEVGGKLIGLAAALKSKGYKAEFSSSPIPLIMIYKGGKKYVLVNKQYATEYDFVVGDIAGGEI